MKKRIITSTFMLILAVVAMAQTELYVSPTGKDTNDGKTPDTPWKSISKVLNNITPGTTVYVMPGTFTSGIELQKKHSGTEGAYVTFKAYDPDNRPRFYYGGSGKWNCFNIQASYIIIDGLELEGYNQKFDQTAEKTDSIAAYNYSKTYHDNGGTGFDWNGCAKYNTNGITVGKGGKDGGFPHHVTIRNCIVHDFPGGGIGSQQSDYLTFDNNIVYNNAWYCMYACSGMSILNPYNSDDVNNVYKMFITNNTVYNNHTKIPWSTSNFRYSDGNGIIIDVNLTPDGSSTDAIKADGAYRSKTLVANNVTYFNGGSGIHAFKAQNVFIVNNTAYHNEQRYNSGYGEIFSQSGKNNRLYNNIMYARSNHQCNNFTSNGGGTYNNNIYYGGKYTKYSNDVVADPQFVKIPSDWTDEADFHLTAESPAIGLGRSFTDMPMTDKDGNSRDLRIDAGAYNYADETAAITLYPSFTPQIQCYNLQGQRIELQKNTNSIHRPQIVIVNGKKVVR